MGYYDQGYGYGGDRDYYRSRRRHRNPFTDSNLAALGKRYADIPVDAVTKAITGLKENYYRNRDLSDKYDQAVAQMMVMEGDQGTKDELVKQLKSDIDAFAESGDAWETGDDFIRQKAKQITGNPEIWQMMKNREIFDEKKELFDKMTAEGKAPMYFDNPNFQTINPDGTLNTYDAYVGSQIERRPVLEDYFTNLEANQTWQTNQFMDVFTSKGVTPERILDVVSTALPQLQNTQEYKQDLANTKAQYKYAGRPWTEQDQLAYDQRWVSDLASVGKEFVWNQTNANLNTSSSRGTSGGTSAGDPYTNPYNFKYEGGQTGHVDWDPLNNDNFNIYHVGGTKNTQDYDVTTIKPMSFNGNVMDIRKNKVNENKILNQPGTEIYNAQFTGDARIYQVVMDPATDGLFLNEEMINKAFKDSGLGLKYNSHGQKKYANELPFTGDTGAAIWDGGRWGDADSDLVPETLTVGNHTLKYIVKGNKPIFLKNSYKGVYNTYEDVEGTKPTGQVLADLTSDMIIDFELNKYNNDIGWRSIRFDESGTVASYDNIGNTLAVLSNPMYANNPQVQELKDKTSTIYGNLRRNNGNATPEEINFLLGLDTIWMPILVAEHRNRTRPKNDPEFSKRKFLY